MLAPLRITSFNLAAQWSGGGGGPHFIVEGIESQRD